MPKHADTKPWERQDGESVKAFEAFSCYLGMGEGRSIRAVAEKLHKSSTLIGRWSRTYGWVERVAAHENDVQRAAHEEALKKSRQMANRHIRTALSLQDKALAALAVTKPEALDPKTILAFIREATRLERDTRAAVVRDTLPEAEREGGQSSLADIITEAWRRRTENDSDD